MLGSYRMRIAVAVLLVLGLLAFSVVHMLPMWDRKQIVESGDEVNATVLTVDQRTENTRSTDPDYYTTVEYRYTVDGQEYTSSRIVPGPSLPQPHGYRTATFPFEEGDRITVHYDTTNPEYAWVTTIDGRVGERGGNLIFVGMAISLLLAYVEAERTYARTAHRVPDNASSFVQFGAYGGAMLRALGVLTVGVVVSFLTGAVLVNVLLST
jgi:hypothetical protein